MIKLLPFKLIFMLMVIVLSISPSKRSFGETGMLNEFISLDEFFTLHPEQNEINAAFKSMVSAPGIPINDITQSHPLRIAMVYPGVQISDYWRRSVDSFTARMMELGISFELDEYFSPPGKDIRLQQAQMKEALASDPDYLVFTMNVLRHRLLIEHILTLGRPKLILQNITTPLQVWEGRHPFLYVGFDHETGSRMLADWFLDKNLDSYGMLYHLPGYVSSMRGGSFIENIEKNSGPKLMDSYYTEGNYKSSKIAALNLLNDHEVDFLFSCSTDISLGCIDALAIMEKDETLINGWGGGSAELDAIMSGTMDVTVMRINDDNGVAMAEAIKLDLEGRGAEIPTVFSGDFVIVEAGISVEELERLKSRAFRYSGQ